MLLRIDYGKMRGVKAAIKQDKKFVTIFFRVVVSAGNIEEAIKDLDKEKSVLAFEYVGTPGGLEGVSLGSKPVIVVRDNLDSFDDLSHVMSQYGKGVTVVIKYHKSNGLMRDMIAACKAYSNIRFCTALSLVTSGEDIVRVGCIPGAKLSDKFYTEGCACPYTYLSETDIAAVEWGVDGEAGVTAETSSKSVTKKKTTRGSRGLPSISSVLADLDSW